MRLLLRFCFLLHLLALTTCNTADSPDCFKSTGRVERETREPQGNFSIIEIHDNINVYITQDTVYKITVEAGKNLLKKITTKQDGLRLVIRNENTCNWVRSYDKAINVYLQCPSLHHIQQNGFGKLESTNTLRLGGLSLQLYGASKVDLKIQTDFLGCDLNGAGSLKLSGSTRSFYYLSTLKTVSVKADDLAVSSAKLYINGENDVYMNCTDTLRLRLTGNGNVFNKGNPYVVKNITGSGKLILY